MQALDKLAVEQEKQIVVRREKKEEEFRKMRALEAEWSGVLDKQARAASPRARRDLAATSPRAVEPWLCLP